MKLRPPRWVRRYLFNLPAEDALVVVPRIEVGWRFTAQVCMNDPIPVTREETARSAVTLELLELGPNSLGSSAASPSAAADRRWSDGRSV